MGNSKAYPVFRTTDRPTAYAQAMRLCALLAMQDDEVYLTADLLTVADVRRMAAVLPGTRIGVKVRTDPSGESVWADLNLTTATASELRPHLPLDIGEFYPVKSADHRFLTALGQGTASIQWSGSWPEDPDADQHGSAKYDGVQVVFHGDQAQADRWTEHHTVFVHVNNWGDLPRARKLAAHIGGEVLGEAQLGF
ncbi:hypothetical protein E5083_05920 [Streptomyces bauhiniae]|uniref:Uncharacterized protein n=1 Tax=Streptomyces bauhiniae TaxID=2340725 RepID=A0A4Z1D8Y6_9ACTN|nr:hypothetical protein [Streptomyces bauhiniae]TGN79187.1 hypothetical protein E5083_05920 [Streptomyces bauhiniae]